MSELSSGSGRVTRRPLTILVERVIDNRFISLVIKGCGPLDLPHRTDQIYADKLLLVNPHKTALIVSKKYDLCPVLNGPGSNSGGMNVI